jgi:putative spermidine/putrescine transport system permease protein
VKLLFNFAGLLIGLTHIFLPFMVLVLISAIQTFHATSKTRRGCWARRGAVRLRDAAARRLESFQVRSSSRPHHQRAVTPRLLGGPTYQVMSR